MSQVYLNLNNQQAGPYDIPTVNGMLTSGQITAETLGWIQGMANWEPVSSNTFASLGIQQIRNPHLPQCLNHQHHLPKSKCLPSR